MIRNVVERYVVGGQVERHFSPAAVATGASAVGGAGAAGAKPPPVPDDGAGPRPKPGMVTNPIRQAAGIATGGIGALQSIPDAADRFLAEADEIDRMEIA